MKKTICLLLVLLLFGLLAGCSNNKQFENDAALLEYLNGMYTLEDNSANRTYYIIENGKIYSFNDVNFSGEVKKLFDTLAMDNKIKELSNLNYETALSPISSAVLEYVQSDVTIKPKKGIIFIDADKSYEKQIHIGEDGIFVKEPDDDVKTQMTKLSGEVDLSGEHFQEIFNKTKEEYAIPMNHFLRTTEEMGNWYLDFWDRKTEIADNTYKLYYASGRETGVLAWNEKMFVHTTGKEATMDGTPTFQMLYEPTLENNQLVISDKMNPDFRYMLDAYVEPLLRRIPGALSSDEIRETFGKRGETKNGVRSCKFVQSGIEYNITIDYNIIIEPGHQTVLTDNPQTVLIMITFQKGIALSSLKADDLA